MKNAVLLWILLVVAMPAAALGQGGLLLNWTDCSLGGTQQITFACDSNEGEPFYLFPSIVAPYSMPSFELTIIQVDVSVDAQTPVPWWQTTFGSCRSGAIDVAFNGNLFGTTCWNIWDGRQTGGLMQFQSAGPTSPNFRLIVSAGFGSGGGRSVPADGAELVLIRVSISRSRTTGAEACSGCALPARLELTSCKLQQQGGYGDYLVTNPLAPGSNVVHWNQGAPTAAANRTWGAVKTLYR